MFPGRVEFVPQFEKEAVHLSINMLNKVLLCRGQPRQIIYPTTGQTELPWLAASVHVLLVVAFHSAAVTTGPNCSTFLDDSHFPGSVPARMAAPDWHLIVQMAAVAK